MPRAALQNTCIDEHKVASIKISTVHIFLSCNALNRKRNRLVVGLLYINSVGPSVRVPLAKYEASQRAAARRTI